MAAAQLTQTLTVERIGDGRYRVACRGSCGGDSGWHIITIGAEAASCDCPGHAFRQGCRHVAAVTDYLRSAPLVVTAAAGPGLVDVDVPPSDCAPQDVA